MVTKIQNKSKNTNLEIIPPIPRKALNIGIVGAFTKEWKWDNGLLFGRGLSKLKNCNNIEYLNIMDIRSMKLKSDILSKFDEYSSKLDVVIVFKGFEIDKDILKIMQKNKTITVLWWMDWWPQFKNGSHKNILLCSNYYNYRVATGYEVALWWNEQTDSPTYHICDCSDPSIFKPIGYKKDIDVCFVGSYDGERQAIYQFLKKKFPKQNIVFSGPGFSGSGSKSFVSYEDTNILYNRSKIILNISRGKLIGYTSSRLWNSLASGSMVLTKETPGLEKFLGLALGYNIEQFSTLKELEHLVKKYLDNESERETIAKHGLEFFIDNRTCIKSASNLLNIIFTQPSEYIQL